MTTICGTAESYTAAGELVIEALMSKHGCAVPRFCVHAQHMQHPLLPSQPSPSSSCPPATKRRILQTCRHKLPAHMACPERCVRKCHIGGPTTMSSPGYHDSFRQPFCCLPQKPCSSCSWAQIVLPRWLLAPLVELISSIDCHGTHCPDARIHRFGWYQCLGIPQSHSHLPNC